MSLTSYPFVFYERDDELLQVWGDVLRNCKRKIINKIYGVWDELSNEWFVEAPILIEFNHGILAVTVKSERYVALEWNKILQNEKPIWFDEEQIKEMPKLKWEENLNWREYSEISDCFGKMVENISLVHDSSNKLIDIMLEIDSPENIVIVDVGDVIAGLKENDWRKIYERT